MAVPFLTTNNYSCSDGTRCETYQYRLEMPVHVSRKSGNKNNRPSGILAHHRYSNDGIRRKLERMNPHVGFRNDIAQGVFQFIVGNIVRSQGEEFCLGADEDRRLFGLRNDE